MDTTKPPETLLEAVRYFADPDHALAFMVAVRWADGQVTCPTCGSKDVMFLSSRRLWKCSEDHPRRQFSIKVGTVMEDSPIGLDKWLPAIWLIANCKNGISSHELARDLKVTQKTAWFMLHRIRLAMQSGTFERLGGDGKTVEVDETWIGGAARSMNKKQRAKAKAGGKGTRGPHAYSGKAMVLGMLERGGRVRTRIVHDLAAETLIPHIKEHVEFGTAVHSDEHAGYVPLERPVTAMDPDALRVDPERLGEPLYVHEAVNHAAEEYVRGNVHTNGIENFWSLLKRTIRGTYVSVEPFHLFRYLDEQAFRFNERKNTDRSRFVEVLAAIVGRRLTYKGLVGLDAALAPQ